MSSSPPAPLSAADVLADLADLSREDDGASQAIVPATLVGDLAAVAPELANNLLPHFHAMEQFSRELGGVALMSAVVRSCLLGEALEQHASCASVAGGGGPDLGMRELLTDSAVEDMRRERERVTSRLKASVAPPWAGMRRLGGGGGGGGANSMPSYVPSAACKALAAEASSLRDRVAKASDLDAWERAFLGEAAGASSSASSLSASKDEDVDEDTKGGERKSGGGGSSSSSTTTTTTTSRSVPAFWARLEREGGSGAGATAEDDGALLVINDDDARALTQDSKDVERDQVEVNSELVKGSSGYDAVVRALETAVTEARKSPGAGCWVDRLDAADADEGEDRGGVIRRFARSVLRAGNRTQSGGDTLDTLCELAVPALGGEDVVLLVPDSSRFAPIRVTVDIGPFEVKAPEGSEGPVTGKTEGKTGNHPTRRSIGRSMVRRSWHWGARATVQVSWMNGWTCVFRHEFIYCRTTHTRLARLVLYTDNCCSTYSYSGACFNCFMPNKNVGT